MMKPAANAPSTMSSPSEPAIATSPPSSSSASRSASCPLECIVASISRTTRAGRARVVSSPAATTMTAKTSSSTVRHSSPDATASTIERATIGRNSPAAPTASTIRPTRCSLRSASRRIGTSAPSAVVVSASPTSTGAPITSPA